MMLSNAPQPQLVTVLPVGMDPRKLSVFRMAFRMHHSHQQYQLLDEAPGHAPDLAIVDVDSVEGWNAWHTFRAAHPHLPALIVTTTPPGEAPAAVLRKPVRIETLFPQMRELLSKDYRPRAAMAMPAMSSVQPQPSAAITQAVPAAPAATAAISEAAAYVASVAPTLSEVITQSQEAHRAATAARQQNAAPAPASDLPQLMDLPDTDTPADSPAAKPDDPDVVRSMLPPTRSAAPRAEPPAATSPAEPGKISFSRFDPHAGLFGMVARLLRQRSAAVVRVREVPVLVLLPAQDKALLLQPLDSLQALCAAPNHEVDQHAYANETLAAVNQEIRPQTLAWQLAIWTCQGRLMRGISADTPLRLRFWPNLTRLAPIPEAMRITAFLTRTPVNLKLITRLLKVPPEHLFNYLAAAYGIGILDIPNRGSNLSVITTEPVRPAVKAAAAGNAATVASDSPATPAVKPAPGNGNLLSRLLKKVIGL
ncbi:hypothetical protein DLM_2599 [Aquitalea magnusonii]|uniref:Uncharacterized protein n=1 Tax=Aquitalea magnusonii TaxID=332411 RepID=A0A3G9GFG7_9NEIS|nr:hypothetical protein [Aquitalea magnusonii]BBF86205.1 hypothetical protein DLM_2599 [Aquitalea magnusonii]